MSIKSLEFNVPYNGDPKLVDYYIGHCDYISLVYGRAEDGYPQGRKTDKGIQISIDDVFKQNEKLRQHNITFNYLLNGTSHNNQEYDCSYRKKFVDYVKFLYKNGIRLVTIGNHLLLQCIIEEVPEIDVSASILLEIDNLAKLKMIHNVGVKYVCLSKTLLKNFNALENIANYNTKHPDLHLYLLVNDPCLNHCMYTNYHNDTLSLLTGNHGACQSFCRMQCTKCIAHDTSKIISASFIRPEDLNIYQNIGFNNFKLCERKQTTQRIKNVCNAYFHESYDGNISDLMAPWSKINGKYPYPKPISENQIRADGVDKYRDYLRFSPDIQNKDLDGYLNFRLKYKKNGCANEDCDMCGYCKQMAHLINNKGLDIIERNIINGNNVCFI